MRAATDAVGTCLGGPFGSIEGRCIAHLWQLIEPLRRATAAEEDDESVAEIGVCHGMFFIGLVQTMGAPRGTYPTLTLTPDPANGPPLATAVPGAAVDA